MAERARFTPKEYAIGIAVVLATFIVIFLGAGAMNLAVPQWLLSAVAAVIGILVWFAIIGRLGKAK